MNANYQLLAILISLLLGVGSIAEQLEANGDHLVLGLLLLPISALILILTHRFIQDGKL